METTNTETLIREILEGSKETIKAKMKAEIEKQIIDQLSWKLRDELSVMASAFVQEELKADISAMLTEAKPQIIEQLKEGFIKIGAQLSEAMVIQATKNLNVGSYNSKEIIKKILE